MNPTIINLDDALGYDEETFPNCFTLNLRSLFHDFSDTFEISEFRDDRPRLREVLNWIHRTQTVMVGFNNIGFDYPILHLIFNNPNAGYREIYDKAQAIINSGYGDRKFDHIIHADKRFAPQIDLFKINHFDNPAKSTGLKALEINMRSHFVVDMPVQVGTMLTREQIDGLLISYNKHDTSEANRFALYNLEAIRFRMSLVEQFGIDVLNWPDTKIGARMMEQRLGAELCYTVNEYGRRLMRQTPRDRIPLADIIFPYIQFNHPEFNRVLHYLRGQVLTSAELKEPGRETTPTDKPGKVQTKGVFTDLKATIDGFEFGFGTGGIHGSINATRVVATDEWLIRDIDVASLYPSIAIVNRLAPEHLGQRFVEVYASLPVERKKWQKEKGKKCVEANTLKLAGNGVYGNSNNPYSVFYDPKFTMTVTVNGQLMLCMLAERLMTVPTLRIIQINTDGITYYIHRDHEPAAAQVCKEWEAATLLTLEDTNYRRMFIRDVNNYIAEGMDGSLKLKGAYWTPDPLNYAESISNAQPPAWHKDLGNVVSVRAAVAAMVHGIDPEAFIRATTNPFDFMLRIKARGGDQLLHGGRPVQKTTRYYVAVNGAELIKLSPPTGPAGAFCRAPGVTANEYNRVMAETRGAWDARVCTKNRSTYNERRTQVQAGYKTAICNDASHFDFGNVDYGYYVNEAKKLIV